jgi:hypothetical protein
VCPCLTLGNIALPRVPVLMRIWLLFARFAPVSGCAWNVTQTRPFIVLLAAIELLLLALALTASCNVYDVEMWPDALEVN